MEAGSALFTHAAGPSNAIQHGRDMVRQEAGNLSGQRRSLAWVGGPHSNLATSSEQVRVSVPCAPRLPGSALDREKRRAWGERLAGQRNVAHKQRNIITRTFTCHTHNNVQPSVCNMERNCRRTRCHDGGTAAVATLGTPAAGYGRAG